MKESAFVESYKQSAIEEFKKLKSLGDKTFDQLNESDFHWQPDPENNSIAINIQHLHGNILSRWTDFLNSDGEKETRKRDQEFEVLNQNREQLIAHWNEAWITLFMALESLQTEDFDKTVYIRHQPHSVVQAINRQLPHYGYHVGQIVSLARQIKGADWESLSIPKGKSAEVNEQMKQKFSK